MRRTPQHEEHSGGSQVRTERGMGEWGREGGSGGAAGHSLPPLSLSSPPILPSRGCPSFRFRYNTLRTLLATIHLRSSSYLAGLPEYREAFAVSAISSHWALPAFNKHLTSSSSALAHSRHSLFSSRGGSAWDMPGRGREEEEVAPSHHAGVRVKRRGRRGCWMVGG